MKLLSLHSLDVRTKRSMYYGMSKLLNTLFSFSMLERVFDYYSVKIVLSIAWLTQKMLSQAKHIYIVIFVLLFVLYSNLAKFYRTSGNSYFNLPSRSPTITTLTLFLVTISKMVSLSQIYDNCWNCFLARDIRNQTSSLFLLKFQIEKAQKEVDLTPNSRQQSKHFFNVLVPSTCPESEPFFSFLANLRFPSMINATCRGIFPWRSTRMASFSMHVSSNMLMCQSIINTYPCKVEHYQIKI